MTWQPMANLDPGDPLPAAEMDAIRENIEYLLSPASGNALVTDVSTTSLVDVDVPGLSVTLTTSGGLVRVSFVTHVWAMSGANAYFYVYLYRDADQVALTEQTMKDTGRPYHASLFFEEPLSPGEHTFKIAWRRAVVAGTMTMGRGQLFVSEA